MRRILGQRDVLLLTFSYFCLNYVFYLLGTWSFLYLVQERSFTGLESGFAGMLPWIGAGIGAGIGGYPRGRHGDAASAIAGAIGCVPMISMPLAGLLLLVAVSVSAPYAAVLALMATFFMIELNEGAFWAATMRVARSDTGAATGVLNTGGNFAGMVSAPIIGALSGAGNWNCDVRDRRRRFALVASGVLVRDRSRSTRVARRRLAAIAASYPPLGPDTRTPPCGGVRRIWRRGWDSNPRGAIKPPSDFESAPL